MAEAIWVFNGAGGQFPSGVFSSKELAEEWITKHQLTGVLTKYPVDIGVYEWTIQKGYFKPVGERKKQQVSLDNFLQRTKNTTTMKMAKGASFI